LSADAAEPRWINSERLTLAGAGVVHLALLGLLSVSWQLAYRDLPQFAEAVPVEVLTVADLARVTEPPKPSMVAAPQENSAPPPEPEAIPEPKPQPMAQKPDPAPKVTAKTPPVKVQAARLDAQELSNLLDKALPKARVKPRDTANFAKTIELAIPKTARLDARATATLEQAIRVQIIPCWNPPIGGADAKKMTVVLHIELAKTGAVIGRPAKVSQTGITAANGDYARAFEETARRAVLRCAPFRLPGDMYEAWKAFELNFDPSELE
jgi:outer membrane biosynthesis protein TonB